MTGSEAQLDTGMSYNLSWVVPRFWVHRDPHRAGMESFAHRKSGYDQIVLDFWVKGVLWVQCVSIVAMVVNLASELLKNCFW